MFWLEEKVINVPKICPYHRLMKDREAIHPTFSRGMVAGLWISLMALLFVAFSNWEEDRASADRLPQSRVTQDGEREVILKRNPQDHYVADGLINGHRVTFLVDTGATHVAVPMHLHRRLGLKPGLKGVARTANGDAEVYYTSIEHLSLGTLEFADVRASLISGMTGNEILLGMSVLGEVELAQRGNRLYIRSGDSL